MIYFCIFTAVYGGILLLYELSDGRSIFEATVLNMQIRTLKDRPDLYWVEVWYECLNGPNVYSLFTIKSSFDRLREGNKIKFTAKKGKFTGWLWKRKLLAEDFWKDTAPLS